MEPISSFQTAARKNRNRFTAVVAIFSVSSHTTVARLERIPNIASYEHEMLMKWELFMNALHLHCTKTR